MGAGFVTLRGEEIKLKLQNKDVEESGVSVIIFSNEYVSSSLCLDELVMILDCSKRISVLPIFYHVDPSDVRKQKGRIGEAFDELGRNQSGNEWKENGRKHSNKLQTWEEWSCKTKLMGEFTNLNTL